MIYLVYVSSATRLLTQAELVELLAQSRDKNLKLGVTGMLLYQDGNFMQVLEGEADAVRPLFYGSIMQDPRHHDIIVLDEGELAERQFPDWSMGFRDLGKLAKQGMPGFNSFMSQSRYIKDFRTDATGCWDLLKSFRDAR